MRLARRPMAGALLVTAMLSVILGPEEASAEQITCDERAYPLFPEILDEPPLVPSPFMADDGREIVTCLTRDGNYLLVPVTIENGEPLDYRSNQWWGKGRQLDIDFADFPALARTGLHSEVELDQTLAITGVPIAEITRNGHPEAYSTAGFMADGEGIVSVLKEDNELVRRLGLTHPRCTRPLFHVFNVIQCVRKDSERGNVAGILYGGRTVHLRFWGHKGWQESIFADEILGYWEIEIQRALDQEEKFFLASRYAHLTEDEMARLTGKLTCIHTGEMVPYYIMRYGFYEGHTSYRADPLAIACIFGLRSIPEIELAFEGSLYETLTASFIEEDTGE